MSTAASGVEAAAAAVVDYGGAAAADGGALEGAQPDAKRQRLEEGQAAPPEFWRPEPRMLHAAAAEFYGDSAMNNFTKGVKFSADGSCLLSNSDDNVLRVFEVPGDHDSIMLEPNVRVLAARMKQVIAEAEKASPAPQRQEAAE